MLVNSLDAGQTMSTKFIRSSCMGVCMYVYIREVGGWEGGRGGGVSQRRATGVACLTLPR